LSENINERAAVNGEATKKFNRRRFTLLARVMGDRRLNEADLRVAYFLIDCFNFEKGYAFPSQSTLVAWTGLSLSAVKRAISRLVRLGIIILKARGGPRRSNRASEYVPNFDAYLADQVVSDVTPPADQVVSGVTPEVVSGEVEGGVIAQNPHPLPPRSENGGVVGDPAAGGARAAGPSPAPDVGERGARASDDRVARAFKLLWPECPIQRGAKETKRALRDVLSLDDAPSVETLVAQMKQYAANVPPQQWRWPHKWLEGEGWLEDYSPREWASGQSRRAAKANGKFPIGAKVQTRDAEEEGGYLAGRVVGVKNGRVEVKWEPHREPEWYNPEALTLTDAPDHQERAERERREREERARELGFPCESIVWHRELGIRGVVAGASGERVAVEWSQRHPQVGRLHRPEALSLTPPEGAAP
jgi:hypothetical protein